MSGPTSDEVNPGREAMGFAGVGRNILRLEKTETLKTG
jgi:hypothetical protein